MDRKASRSFSKISPGRVQNEARLRESEELYRSLAESSQDLIFVINEQDRVEDVNSYAAAALQKPYDEIINADRSSIFPPDIGQRQDDALHRVFSTGRLSRSESAMSFHGSTRWFDHVLVPLRNPDGSVRAVLGISRDITDRKRAEDLTRSTLQRLETLTSNLYAGIMMVSEDGTVEHVNQALCDMYHLHDSLEHLRGLTSEEMIKKIAGAYAYPKEAVASIRDLVTRGKPVKGGEIAMRDGRIVMVDYIPIIGRDGQRRGRIWHHQDITDRKRAEEALRESEEKFRTLFNNANDMITLHGFDRDGMPGQYLEVNDVACRRLKYTRKELLALSPKDIVAPESAGSISRNVQQLKENGHATFELVHQTKDRRKIPVEVSAHLFDFNGKPMVLALVRDITERKSSEEGLKQREQQYRLLAENSVDIINRLTPGCVCTFVSPAVTPVLGYREKDVLGKSMLEMIHPDDLARVRQDLAAISCSGIDRTTSTFRFRHRDGHYLWFESTTRIIRDENTGQVKEFLNISRDITSRYLKDPASGS